jgi:hypothetical protein
MELWSTQGEALEHLPRALRIGGSAPGSHSTREAAGPAMLGVQLSRRAGDLVRLFLLKVCSRTLLYGPIRAS